MKNLKEISDEFYDFIWSDEVFKRAIPMEIPVGWNDGGCFSLMIALKLWLGDAVKTYKIKVDGSDVIHHGFVIINNLYIDGQGINSRDRFCDIWENEEMLKNIEVSEFNIFNEKLDRDSVYFDMQYILNLCDCLEERFGKDNFLEVINNIKQ